MNGPNGSTTNQPIGFTYDPSGNMTSDGLGAYQMTYDGENRMTGYDGSAEYTYDGNGLRVAKSSGGTTMVSIFSGSTVIAEYDNGAAPSSPSREYVYNGAGDTTGLLAMISGSTTTYYHQDRLSVRLTTDENGNIVTQEGHFPFGEQWYQSGAGNKWFFTSYNRDSESGLDYAKARNYDSRIAAFSLADPLAGTPADPQSWNRYAYGRNDPIDITDPSGQSWWSKLLIDIGIGIASYFLGPEIDSFLGLGGDAADGLYGEAGSVSADSYADSIAGTFPTGIQGLSYRAGAQAATSLGGEAATATGGSLTAGFIGAGAAQAAQSSDQKSQKSSRRGGCPPVPIHPKGARVNANISETAADNNANPTIAKVAWVDRVRTNGDWDYKKYGLKYDDFGNFNYGATGAVLNYSFQTLTNGAVFARLLIHPVKQLTDNGLSNPWHKNKMIRRGMQYEQNDCGGLE